MNTSVLNPAEKNLDFYAYGVDIASLANGASTSQSFSIDTDSDFFMMKFVMQADLAGVALTSSSDIIPLCTIQITDGGSSRQMFSRPAALKAVFGNGENPFILPAPRQFSAGSSVTVAITNY